MIGETLTIRFGDEGKEDSPWQETCQKAVAICMRLSQTMYSKYIRAVL